MLTNIEKIALAISRGTNNFIIDEIPTTPYWLVSEKQINHNWKLTMCNPMGTKYHCLGKNVTNKNYLDIWVELVKLKAAEEYSKTLR